MLPSYLYKALAVFFVHHIQGDSHSRVKVDIAGLKQLPRGGSPELGKLEISPSDAAMYECLDQKCNVEHQQSSLAAGRCLSKLLDLLGKLRSPLNLLRVLPWQNLQSQRMIRLSQQNTMPPQQKEKGRVMFYR